MSQAQILNQKDYKRLLAATKMTRHADRNRLAVVLSFGAGLRAKEIASVTVDNVIDATGRVKSQFELNSSQTKGRKSRTVFLSDSVMKEIESFMCMNEWMRKERHGALLRSQKLGAFTSQSMQNLFKHLFKMIGMEGCSSHSGRRSLLTNLNDNGINLRTIQKIAGHAHINTTAMYLSVTDTQLHNAVNSVSY